MVALYLGQSPFTCNLHIISVKMIELSLESHLAWHSKTSSLPRFQVFQAFLTQTCSWAMVRLICYRWQSLPSWSHDLCKPGAAITTWRVIHLAASFHTGRAFHEFLWMDAMIFRQCSSLTRFAHSSMAFFLHTQRVGGSLSLVSIMQHCFQAFAQHLLSAQYLSASLHLQKKVCCQLLHLAKEILLVEVFTQVNQKIVFHGLSAMGYNPVLSFSQFGVGGALYVM